MISIRETSKSPYVSKYVVELVGLSSDVKPVGKFENYTLVNGSSLFEMDTFNLYMYDEASQNWVKP